MSKTFELAKRTGTNIWNAVRMFRIQYELTGIDRNNVLSCEGGLSIRQICGTEGKMEKTEIKSAPLLHQFRTDLELDKFKFMLFSPGYFAYIPAVTGNIQ